MINKNSVIIYCIKISNNLSKISYYKTLLNNEEIFKANRFYFEKDRDCYILARGKLRELLGTILDINPKKIEFKYNDFNKPFIDSNIKFNISHSKDYILIGFSNSHDIGVDIEYIKDNIKYKQLIYRFFSENEIKEFLTIPEQFQKEAFFNGWTRKEAYIKAIGKGLNISLNSFDVSLKDEEEIKIINIDGKKNTIWKLYNLSCDKEYKSSFAINTSINNLELIYN
ncbi:MAG: 4'-phosphopantetheinyl transferase superfamily protein [Candidatus Sericytochromatia bacterium]